jgi:hypothetical protein
MDITTFPSSYNPLHDSFLSWYVLITLLGWLTFPLAYYLFPALSDRAIRSGVPSVCWSGPISSGCLPRWVLHKMISADCSWDS